QPADVVLNVLLGNIPVAIVYNHILQGYGTNGLASIAWVRDLPAGKNLHGQIELPGDDIPYRYAAARDGEDHSVSVTEGFKQPRQQLGRLSAVSKQCFFSDGIRLLYHGHPK